MNMILLTASGDAARAQRAARSGREEPPPEAPPLVALLPVPLFHVTGCNCVLHTVTIAGGCLVMMYRWDATEALRLIEREGVTVFTGVPSMSREMLQHPDWESTNTSSLRSMGGGGAAIPTDLVRRIDDGLSQGRPGVGYGLTETAGIATAISNEFYVANPTSVGPLVPCMEAVVVDEDGATLDPGQRGELRLRGPNVMKGYLNRPDATAEAIVDGWFRTGDIAEVDDAGWIHIKDRIKDIVIRGGENIHCSEVEEALYELDQIAEAAVFGLPDERLGEAVAAAVVLVPGTELDEAALAEHLDGRLARFKHPRRVWFLDEALPRNANGKFLKRELRERFGATP
jgi:long-chain acyl-CoA synthetase